MLCRVSQSFDNSCSTFLIYSISEKKLGHEGEYLIWKFYIPGFVLICYHINGFVRVLNGTEEQSVRTRTANGANKRLVLHMQIRCCSVSIKAPGGHSTSILVNEFDVRSVLHGQVSLTAVNHFYVFHEGMNGSKNLKIH